MTPIIVGGSCLFQYTIWSLRSGKVSEDKIVLDSIPRVPLQLPNKEKCRALRKDSSLVQSQAFSLRSFCISLCARGGCMETKYHFTLAASAFGRPLFFKPVSVTLACLMG